MKKCIIVVAYLYASTLVAQTVPVFDSLQLTYADTLYFESGKWNLDSLAMSHIDHFPTTKSKKERIYLTAHTDAIGSLEYNEKLAQKRAETTKGKLLEKNWEEEMIVIQTFGERSPTASNETDEERQLNRRVRIDLFQPVPYMLLRGKIIDPKSEEGVANTQIKVHSRSFTDSLQANEKGEFELKLPVDSVVGIDFFAKGYFLKTQMMKVKLAMNPTLSIILERAEVGASADLSKLYFVGNQAILLKHSESELPKIKRFLEVNNHLKVEIAGHVNYPNSPPVTEDTFEWDLSVRRAEFLYNWLLEEGVSEEQITYKGYGNHEMRYPRAKTEREQELNRRVEIRVLGVR